MAEKEYIERDMYYQKINGLSKGGCGDYPLYCLAINDCMNVLDEMPAADVAPVKHGHWVGYETKSYKNSENGIAKKYYRCSSCRYFNAIRSNYCPKCGAKMDGGDLNGS